MSAVSHHSSHCSYCRLPIAAANEPVDGEPAFCCFGCRLAADIAGSEEGSGLVRRTLARLGIAIFFTMNVMVFSMVLWSQEIDAVSPEKAGPLADTLRDLFRSLGLLFSVPVFLLLGVPLLSSAWAQLKRRIIATDGLIALGVGAALFFSAYSVFADRDQTYFEVVCMVLVLVTLGRWMEALGKQRTTEAVESLEKLLPETVRLQRNGEPERIVPIDEVRCGDLVRVLPGERLPCDGRIVNGRAALDEGLLTGESAPVTREPGELVAAGTWNIDGSLEIAATAGVGEGTVARLAQLVRDALASKGHFERLADRVVRWFVPAVLGVALWTAIDQGRAGGFEAGLLGALAVLLIACPCALGLATPMAIWTAVGAAAKRQVLFRSGTAIERFAGVDTFFFDKTGTLTESELQVAEVITSEASEIEVLARAAGLARQSAHAASRAIVRFAAASREAKAGDVDVRQVPGRGLVACDAAGVELARLGSPRLFEGSDWRWPTEVAARLEQARADGDPLVAAGWDGVVRGLFLLREKLRPHAAQALRDLERGGARIEVLTGDHAGRARRLSEELRVRVRSELEPLAKVSAVEEASASGRRIAMVGDGINDAPALARADVGIALGCGAEISREVADVCLLSNDPSRVSWAFDLARRTVSVIRLNLFWAFAYNVIGIGFAAAGKLNPILAALAMAISSFLVVVNSLRLSSPGDASPKAGQVAPETGVAAEARAEPQEVCA
ncbi:MAG: cation-translocating P-type ATPase [Planctomycetota bacterium]